MTQVADKTVEAWTHYWRGGHPATSFLGPGRRQDLDLRAFWTDFFGGFGEDTVLLDICTGNGEVAALAAETALARGTSCSVHGIDSAKIMPHKSVPNAPGPLRRVRFWPGVAVEDMPFEDAVFDGISGQFALEYTDRTRSVREIARVLRGGGRLCLLMHTADSDVVRDAGATLDELRVMFEAMRIFRTAQAAFKRLFTADGNPLELDDLTRKHRAVVADFEERLARLAEMGAREDSAGAFKFASDRLGTLYFGYKRSRRDRALQFISVLEREMRLTRIRMKTICQAALDESEVAGVADLFAECGLEMDAPARVTTPSADRYVGWRISGRRR